MASNTFAEPHTTQFDSQLSAWPALPTVNDLQSMYINIEEKWLQHPCPLELKRLPITVPTVVARIIEESTRKETYILSDCDEHGSDDGPREAATPAGVSEPSTDMTKDSGPGKKVPGLAVEEPEVGECGKAADMASGTNVWKSFAKHITHKKGDCVSCLETIPLRRLEHLPCEHQYCGPCLKQMTFTAMSTERLFPPRCCSREIPSEIIFAALTSKEKKQYISKSKEYTTLPAERWYCPKANCARWIHPKYIISKNASQKCPYCKTQICSTCRRFAHNYSGCGYNAELAPLLKQARRSRWQRCYHCGEMVESLGGCQHIHCRCGADFCYGCGNQWQSEACVCSTVRHVPDEYLQFDELRNEEAYLSTVIAIIEDSGREEINENRRRAHGSHLERKGESFRSKEYRKLEIDKRIKALSGFLSKANKLQQMHLINRQKEEGLAYFSRQRAEVERFNQERRELTGKQDRNLNARTQKLLSSQTAEIKQMKSAHDEEEIALVARLPRLFKHQSNAEDREMAVVTKLRGIQETEKKNLILEHTRAMREADEKNSLEREALLSSLKAEWDTEQLHARTALQSLVQGFIYDRYWFDRAVAKREDMLAKYRLQLINSRSGLEELTFVEAFGS